MKVESLRVGEKVPAIRVDTVLIVDASLDDSSLIAKLIRQHWGTSVKVITATTILDGLREYRHEKPDCILIDHRLADGEGIDLLHMLNDVEAPLPAPAIYLAATDSPRLAVRVLKAGAMDYLAKSWLDSESLVHAIEKAVESTELARIRIRRRLDVETKNRDLQTRILALQESDRFRKQIAGLAPSFLYVQDVVEDRTIYANQTMLSALGYSETDWNALDRGSINKLIHPKDLPAYFDQSERMAHAQDGEPIEYECRMQRRDQTWVKLRFKESVFERDASGKPTQIVGIAEEVIVPDGKVDALQEQTASLENQIADLKAFWDQEVIGIALASESKPNQIKINPALSKWLNVGNSLELTELARAFGFPVSVSSFGKALTKGVSSQNVDRTVLQENGSSLRLKETVFPLNDASGNAAGFIAYFLRNNQDQEKPKHEENLAAKLEATEKRLRAAEEKLANYSKISEEGTEGESQSLLLRTKQAEDRLNELGDRWRQTVALLLAADEARDELNARNAALEAELRTQAQRHLDNQHKQNREIELLKLETEQANAQLKSFEISPTTTPLK